MTTNVDIPREVGPKYEVGFVSETYGPMGYAVRPNTYRRSQQLIKRSDVVAALQTALADRDLNFWTRITQPSWSTGSGQAVFDVNTSYDHSQGTDNHNDGQLTAIPAASVLNSIVTESIYRGGCVAPQSAGGAAVAVFGWRQGKYIWSNNITVAVPTWTEQDTPAASGVLDVVTDGSNIWFAVTVAGVWTTTAAVPGNLTQYDSGASGPYHRLAYNPLNKTLYGITAPSAGAALHKINPAGAPTVIFDFLTGRLDAIGVVAGNVFVQWNSGDSANTSPMKSVTYKYDGTNITQYIDNGDALQALSLVSAFGAVASVHLSSEVFNDSADPVPGQQFILNIGGQAYAALLDGFVLTDSTTKSPMGSGLAILSLQSTGAKRFEASLYAAAGGVLWRADYEFGGISRSFGNPLLTIAPVTYKPCITTLIAAGGKILASAILLDQTSGTQMGGAIWQLSGGANDNQPTSANDNALVGSRMDAGLPYVPKFWYAFELITDALSAGQSVEVSYSFDDGLTFSACDGSPFTAVNSAGLTKLNAVINGVNPHVRYKIRPLPPTTGGQAPVIYAVSAQFAPSNPAAKMWQFTLRCVDSLRHRNEQVSDISGQDLIDYLFNISGASETVTFYDANETPDANGNLIPHTCWVMTADFDQPTTAGTYSRLREEGDIFVTLWEVQST